MGLGAHLVLLWWYAATGLVAPTWAVLVLLAIWVAFSVLAYRLWRTRPAWMLAVPVAEVAIWVAVVSAGDAFLNWTA